MKPEMLAYVRYRIERSRETLFAAKLLLSNGLLHDTVNRLYYACFQVVSALLLIEGKSSSKHSGVCALFETHWIRTGRLPAPMGPFYRRLFDYRQKADYRDLTVFTPEKVAAWLQESEGFIDAITDRIRQLLPELNTNGEDTQPGEDHEIARPCR